ncbi:MAG: 2-phosphosulfolactate phosphatase [Chthoniobacteraceae bacterium]
MRIAVALNPAEIARLPQRDLSRTTCVVFDVLRATSSMITALAGGAREIYPVCTIEEARELKADMPHALLGGERDGEIIHGFDVGNSPFEYRELRGRTIVTTTTNGTAALRACEGAETVLVGAMLNLTELGDEIIWRDPEELLLVCAGTFEEFALEDACAAGLLIGALAEEDLSDSAHAALSVARHFPTPLAALRAARNGRALAAKGRGQEVEWCAQVSLFNVVGIMENAVIRPIED